MQAIHLPAGWDTAILIAPFFGLLAFWMFGLDERVAAPRERSARRRFCPTDPDGRSDFCDPDGRPAKTRRNPPPSYSKIAGNSAPASPLESDPLSAQAPAHTIEIKRNIRRTCRAAAARDFR